MNNFKDDNFREALDELRHLCSCVYIGQITADPKIFMRFYEQLSRMQLLMGRKLFDTYFQAKEKKEPELKKEV